MTGGKALAGAGRGKLITIEGGDGAGKSTQVRMLAEMLERRGVPVTATREPGGSPGAEKIRRLLLDSAADWDLATETLLHFAARADHYADLVRPAIRRGDWVISDRFTDSTRAYQGWGMGFDMAAIESLRELALGGFRPDLTLILDLPVEASMARLKARGGDPDRYERMDAGFHRRLRQGFLRIAEREPDRCVVVDAGGPPEAIFSRIEAHVLSRLLGEAVP